MSIYSKIHSNNQGTPIVLLLICREDFNDQEYLITKSILQKNGIKTYTASDTDVLAIGQYGLKVKPEILIENIKPGNFNAIVLLGGKGVSSLLEKNILIIKITEFFNLKKIIASICSGVRIIANSGIMRGIKATGNINDKEILEGFGVNFRFFDVVSDNIFITAEGQSSVKKFAELIVKKILER